MAQKNATSQVFTKSVDQDGWLDPRGSIEGIVTRIENDMAWFYGYRNLHIQKRHSLAVAFQYSI